jgi:four helix bundle protein
MPDSHTDFEPGRLNLDIPVFQKTYELYKAFYQLVAHFPKKDRYAIGQKIENSILELIEGIITASQLSKSEKVPTLHSASIKLDVLKVLIRCCKDLKIIDNKNYLLLESQLQEIGKMLGGWIKASTYRS